MKVIHIIFLLFFMSSCAYRWGNTTRSLPGGYRQVSIPIFKNKTQETGVEVAFTNSLVQEFQRSTVARVIEEDKADAKIVGEIEIVRYEPGGPKISDQSNYLPQGTVLATVYNTILVVNLKMLRKSDNTELWAGSFRGERSYNAPQVTLSGVNSVNPLYNLSARRQNIEAISVDLMAEAFDRLTENF